MNVIIFVFCIPLLMLMSISTSYARTYVVDQTHSAADDGNSGTPEKPLKTISAAARKVRAGDTVMIHDGVYRERVRLTVSGSTDAPITFAAAPGARPVITGAVPLNGPWEELGQGVFRTSLPDDLHNMGWLFVNGHGARHVNMLELTEQGEYAVGSYVRGSHPAIRNILNEVPVLDVSAVFTIGSFGQSWNEPPIAPDATPSEGEPVADSTPWRIVRTEPNGMLDLAKVFPNGIGNSVIFLVAYVYSPSDEPGGLRKPEARRERDDRPSFTGRYVPHFAPPLQAQPMRTWVNGQPVRWEARTPRVSEINLRKGWNTIMLQLAADERGPWRVTLGVSANRWGNPSEVPLFVQAHRPQDMRAPPPEDARNHLIAPAPEGDMRLPVIGQWLVAGPFADEPSDQKVYVYLPNGASPQEQEIEWATRPTVIEIASDAEHIHLRGLTVRHAANGPQGGAVSLGPSSRIEDCEVTDSLGRGIDVGNAPNATVRNCRVLRHGCTGIAGRGARIQVLDNDVIGNNWLHFSHGWESGGMKIVRSRDSLIRGNRVIDNEAWGIWLDWECVGNRIENNLCVNNRAAGIFLEASRGRNVIANNIVVGTRMGGADWGDGIYMHDTSDTLIAHNLCLDNAQFGIRVNLRTSRTLDDGKEVESSYNSVVNNISAGNGAAGLHIPVNRERQWGNRSDGNVLMPREQDGAVAQSSLGPLDDDDRMELFGPMGATMSSAPFLSLELWQRLGFDRHSLADQPIFRDRSGGDFRPAPACPSLNHPVPVLIEVSETMDGRNRRFPTTSAGPFEGETEGAALIDH